MYKPKAFQVDDPQVAIEFMRRHNFATVVTNGPDGLEASHAPVLIHAREDGQPTLHAHFARANPQWHQFDGSTEVLAIFQGPHGYVSPSLYETHPSVPTWNYQVAHAYGIATVIDDPKEVRSHVLELVKHHEGSSTKAWKPNLPEDYLQAMLRQIVAVSIDVRRIETKFKLGQNRSLGDRQSVATSFASSADSTLRELGEAMRATQT